MIEALKSSNQAVIDQVASRIYSNMLSVTTEIQDDPDWSKKDEKLKWTLHTIVNVFGDILKAEDLLEQVEVGNYDDAALITDLAQEHRFLLLDLLGLYYEMDYSTWNLINLFTPDDLNEAKVAEFIKPAVQSASDIALLTAHEGNTTCGVLTQALTDWTYWCEVYKSLLIRTYDARPDDTIVAFHSLMAVSARLISASHIGWLLLLFRARSIRRLL
ncbi:MAG TPA: hypothetical protein VGW58_00795 [Pyrinomonadaceae bacterium]|nr:hypothetical protein [Pyrinomonadaceae bacterium]